MWKNVCNLLPASFAALLLTALPSVGMSQSIWLPPSEGSSVSLEVFKVDWAKDRNEKFASSVWFLTGRYQASQSITIVGELPMSIFVSGPISSTSSLAVSNPYLGILFNPENSGLIGEAGVRFPYTFSTGLDAQVNGLYSEFDRWEAFIRNLLTVRGRFGTKIISSSGKVHARILGGGTLWLPTRGGDARVFADAVGQIWFQQDHYMFGATLSSRTKFGQSGPNIAERSEFQLGFGAIGTFGNVRPGFHIHIPIGDNGLIGVGETVDAVFGVNITVLFGQPDGISHLE